MDMKAANWSDASKEMLNSTWARAVRLANMMFTGTSL
jgi:hypothetical protein